MSLEIKGIVKMIESISLSGEQLTPHQNAYLAVLVE